MVGLGPAACGTSDNGDTTPVESSSTASPNECAGGPACGVDEICVAVQERCECDAGFEHCTLLEVTPGCSGVPFDCIDADDPEACHVKLACGTAAGRIEDDVLTCDPVDACIGDCDGVGGCLTAGSDASQTSEDTHGDG